jgi:hypothetical protein
MSALGTSEDISRIKQLLETWILIDEKERTIILD